MILADGRNASVAPQAFAETSPLFYQGYFLPRTGLPLEASFATYAQLYKAQPWVATVVNKISNLIARLGINVWDVGSDAGKMLDVSSPYASLISKPCDTMDPYSFWLWVASTIEIYGEAFLLKVRGPSGKTQSFLPMHPALTQIQRDDNGVLVYRFMGQPNELIAESDVVPFRMYDPDGTMRGLSRLEPLRSTLMSEDSVRRANQSSWTNGARPSMVVTSEKALGVEGRERLRRSFAESHTGSGQAGKTVVLEDGVTAAPMQLSADQMQYIESRKLNREEVCAVFDIPPTAVGILDHATFSNITEQMRSVYRDSMAPRIEFIESVLNWHVAKEFNGAKVAKFAVAEVLRGDFETRATSVAQLVQSGIMKPSEARPLFDLGDAGGVADKLYANAAIQELGRPAEKITIAATDAGPTTPSGIAIVVPPVGAPKAPIAVPSPEAQKYIRNIAAQIGRGKSIQEAARGLLGLHPDDEGVIAAACAHIIERDHP